MAATEVHSDDGNQSVTSNDHEGVTAGDQLLEQVPVLIYLLLIVVIGITGNGFVFYVYKKKFRLSTASVFFIWLSLVNIICCCVVIPIEVALIVGTASLTQDWLCKLSRFANSWTTISTGTILVAIATDRYRKICRHTSKQISQRTARIISIGCLVTGLLYSWPSLVFFGMQDGTVLGSDFNGTACRVQEIFQSTVYPLVYQIMYALLFALSVVFVIVFYWRIYKRIKFQANKSNSMTSLTSIQSSSKTETMIYGDSRKPIGDSTSFNDSASFVIESRPSDIIRSKSENILSSDADGSPRLHRRVTWKQRSNGLDVVAEAGNQERGWKSNEMLIAHLSLPPNRRSILKRRSRRTVRRTTSSNSASAGGVVTRTDSNTPVAETPSNDAGETAGKTVTVGLVTETGKTVAETEANRSNTDIPQNSRDPNMSPDASEDCNHSKPPSTASVVDNDISALTESEEIIEDIVPIPVAPPRLSVKRFRYSVKSKDGMLSPEIEPVHKSHSSPEFIMHQPVQYRESSTESLDRWNIQSGKSAEFEGSGMSTYSEDRDDKSVTEAIFSASWTERRISWRRNTARRTAYIMFLITVSAVLSYLPVLCLETLKAVIEDFERDLSHGGRVAYNFFLRSYFLNVAVSPFVYGAFDRKFRVACRNIIKELWSSWRQKVQDCM